MKCLEFDQIRTEKSLRVVKKISRKEKNGLFIPRPQNRNDGYRSGVMSSALFRFFFSFKRPVLVKLLDWSFLRFVFFFDLCCCLFLAMDGRTDRHFHKYARVQ